MVRKGLSKIDSDLVVPEEFGDWKVD